MAGYKINSSESGAFLYSKYKQAEKEISEMTPFTIATNSIKYFGVTLTKPVPRFAKILKDSECQDLKDSEEGNGRRPQKI